MPFVQNCSEYEECLTIHIEASQEPLGVVTVLAVLFLVIVALRFFHEASRLSSGAGQKSQEVTENPQCET